MNMRYIHNVVSLELDPAPCVGCGMCISVCPHGVFVMDGRHAAIADRDACMECGACARNCPLEAITVNAGVGCATGLINRALGRKGDCCCADDSCADGQGTTSCCGDASKDDRGSGGCCG